MVERGSDLVVVAFRTVLGPERDAVCRAAVAPPCRWFPTASAALATAIAMIEVTIAITVTRRRFTATPLPAHARRTPPAANEGSGHGWACNTFGVVIFVRHGRAIVQSDVPAGEWPLDPEHVGTIAALRAVLPELPVVCSDLRRAVETARFFGEPLIDPRLAEVARPWSQDLEEPVRRYFRGEAVAGWESQVDARVADPGGGRRPRSRDLREPRNRDVALSRVGGADAERAGVLDRAAQSGCVGGRGHATHTRLSPPAG